jgi:hypothetical protein
MKIHYDCPFYLNTQLNTQKYFKGIFWNITS